MYRTGFLLCVLSLLTPCFLAFCAGDAAEDPREQIWWEVANLLQRRENSIAVSRLEDEISDRQRFPQAAVQSESPQHSVELTQRFYLATTEVTQRQFEQIMSYDTLHYKAKDKDPEGRRPAEKMAWEFTDRLTLADCEAALKT